MDARLMTCDQQQGPGPGTAMRTGLQVPHGAHGTPAHVAHSANFVHTSGHSAYNGVAMTDAQAPTSVEAHMKRDKDSIYGHPLFPLLALIFEKCELATCTSRQPGGASDVACSLQSFNEDVRVFANQAKSEKSYFSVNPELDNLMVQAIQVLRFHLLEMEKVHELCDNFCQRYIQCLKSKMPIDLVVDERDVDTPSDSYRQSSAAAAAGSIGPVEQQGLASEQRPSSSGNVSAYNSRHDDAQSCSSEDGVRSMTRSNSYYQQDSSLCDTGDMGDSIESGDGSGDENSDTNGSSGRRQKKRGIFPKTATTVLRNWLFQHLSHPYPSEDQKKQLAIESGLNNLQVNNWFINARRRIVQPMIDQSNRSGPTNPYSPDANGLGYLDSPTMMRAADFPGMPGEMDMYAAMANPYFAAAGRLPPPPLVPAHYHHSMMLPSLPPDHPMARQAGLHPAMHGSPMHAPGLDGMGVTPNAQAR